MKKTILIIASACAFIFGSTVLISCDNASTTSTEETTEEHVHAEGEEHEHAEETTTTEEEVVVEETTTEGETAEAAKYACSMKCEGDKTYASADDKCPKCGMELTEVKAEETATEGEGEPETEKAGGSDVCPREPERGLLDLGFDSLKLIELASRVRTALQLEVPVGDLLRSASVLILAEVLLEQLGRRPSLANTSKLGGDREFILL